MSNDSTRRVIAGALVALVLGGWSYPREIKSANPHGDLVRSINVALKFWKVRDVSIPCDRLEVGLHRAPDNYGLAHLRRCEITLHRERYLEMIAPYHGDERTKMLERRLLCTLVTHEIGHLGGLPHSSTLGLMSGFFYGDTQTPWPCRTTFPLPRR